MSDERDFEFRLESRLTSHGVYVQSVDEQDTGYAVEYESIAGDSEGVIPHREVGRVINVFRDLHPDDWAGVRIDADVTDFEGNKLGSWHVDPDWIDRLHNGDLSEVEFSQLVVDTIDHVESRD
jgi:hypothetical protein